MEVPVNSYRVITGLDASKFLRSSGIKKHLTIAKYFKINIAKYGYHMNNFIVTDVI